MVHSYNLGLRQLVLVLSILLSACSMDLIVRAPQATISNVSPYFISEAGGETITLTGEGFAPNLTVYLNDQICTSPQIISSQQMTCIAPSSTQISTVRISLRLSGFVVHENTNLLRVVQWQGNPSLTTNEGLRRGLHAPFGLAAWNSQLWIGDVTNERVTYYSNAPTTDYALPDLALGQVDLDSKVLEYVTQRGSAVAYQIATDGTRLAVTDTHRVLIWNTLPTRMGQPADLVIGQPDFISTIANNGGLSARSLNNIRGVAIADGKLFVADTSNRRVLIWNTFPTENFQPADVVLGQPGFTTNTSNNPNRTAGMSAPYNIFVMNNKLIVPDRSSHRVLIWNSVPTVNHTAPDVYLGQTLSTQGTNNSGGISLASLSSPSSVWSDGTRLVVTEDANFRALVWNTFPTTNKQAASFQLGQSSTSTQTSPTYVLPTATTFRPTGVTSDGTSLYIADNSRQRILKWTTFPTVANTAPDIVIGQPNFTTQGARTPPVATDFVSPYKTATNGARFISSDTSYRILLWNTPPTSSYTPPDSILGQPTFADNNFNQLQPNPAANTMGAIFDLAMTDNKIIAADRHNNRVLIWNSIPNSNNVAADVVLGQALFTTANTNDGGLSASSLNFPECVATDGTKLFVCDRSNNRVLIWNSIPSSNNTPADVILGQPAGNQNTANNGGISASSLSIPSALTVFEGKLYVTDSGNHRILVWNSVPTTNNAPSDYVIGQSDMSTGGDNRGANDTMTRADGFTFPTSTAISSQTRRLYVCDTKNDRILIYNADITSNNPQPIGVIGQKDINSLERISLRGVQYPRGIFYRDGKLYISDYLNGRALIMTE